jgi:hypothetical protein
LFETPNVGPGLVAVGRSLHADKVVEASDRKRKLAGLHGDTSSKNRLELDAGH